MFYVSMENLIFFTVFPLFALILSGVLVRQLNWFSESFASDLLKFVFYFPLPALMFMSIAGTHFSEIFDRDVLVMLIAFLVGQVFVFFSSIVLRRLMGVDFKSAVLDGLNASISNTALLGMPLLIGVFGNRVVVPASITVVAVSVLFFPAMVVLLEMLNYKQKFDRKLDVPRIAGLGQTKLPHAPFKIWVSVVYSSCKNPLILAPIFGLIASYFNVQMPHVVTSYMSYLENATIPCALVAIGMNLSTKSIKSTWKYGLFISAMKLFVLPAVALVFVLWLKPDPLYGIIAVIVAGVPTAKSVLMLAQRYKVGEDHTITSIFISTILSLFSFLFWIAILNHFYPTYFLYFANVYFS